MPNRTTTTTTTTLLQTQRAAFPPPGTGRTNPHVPTAAFLFCNQCLLLYDHWKDACHWSSLMTPTSPPTNWLLTRGQILRSLSTRNGTCTATTKSIGNANTASSLCAELILISHAVPSPGFFLHKAQRATCTSLVDRFTVLSYMER